MKILVTGANGQLGHDIIIECKKRGIQAIGVDIEEMDITDIKAIESVVTKGNFSAIIHCAAWTAVDQAEDNPEDCRKVNTEGTQNIVNICKKNNLKLMYFSTDYVFNGNGSNPWNEMDQRNPLSVYGKTKYEGELAVETLEKYFIIRTSWVFGRQGNNFIKTMLRLGKEKGKVSVVNDQVGAPTYTYDLAKLSVDMIITDAFGIYHAANEGFCSWYDFAKAIFKEAKMNVEVTPVDSNAFPAKAIRPKNSRLNKEHLDKNGFQRLPTWEDALKRYLKEIKW